MSKQFGRYVIQDEVKDELGRGAFGRVYRAFDPNVNRHVAIKVLSSQPDGDMLNRFRDESKTAGKLEHENIVKVYDFELQSGVPYLVMELLEGETLEVIIKRGTTLGKKLEILDKVEIMFQVARGLQYAHSRNVVHRDIKPSNIMVLPNGTAKVMDFGIARVIDLGSSRRSNRGDLAGTVLYMAPEQFKEGGADKRSDIFSYGDIFYELLTGEQPFHAQDFASAMYRITTHEPPPLRSKVPDCPAALEALVQRLMMKDREFRPDGLEEVIFDTQPILQQLRQERAATIACTIEGLVESGDVDGADKAIRWVLDLDPLNAAAGSWRNRLRDLRFEQTLRARAAALVEETKILIDARKFGRAIQLLEQGLQRLRKQPDLTQLLVRVRRMAEVARRANALIAEARNQATVQPSVALASAIRALHLDAANPEAEQFCKELRERFQKQLLMSAIAEAEVLRRRGDFSAALERLLEGAADTRDPRAVDLRQQIEQEQETVASRGRATRFRAALNQARDVLQAERPEEAAELAEALCAAYPDQAGVGEVRLEVREYLAARRRIDGVGGALQAGRLLANEHRFQEARDVLERGLRSYPGDEGLRALLEVIRGLAEAQDRMERVDQAVARALSLQSADQLTEALATIQVAIDQFGADSKLIECQRNLRLELMQREYQGGLTAVLEKSRGQLEQNDAASAVQTLEDAAFRYPGEPEVQQLLSTAREQVAAQRQQESVRAVLARASRQEAIGQASIALELIEVTSLRFPGNPDLERMAAVLQENIANQRLQRLLAAHIRIIEAAIQQQDWAAANQRLEQARSEFPDAYPLTQFPSRIRELERQTDLSLAGQQVDIDLEFDDVASAENRLSKWEDSPDWQALRVRIDQRRDYLDRLQKAQESRLLGEFERASVLLQPALSDAPDKRAQALEELITQDRQAAEERARLAREEQQQREEERRRLEERQAGIAAGRQEAAHRAGQGDFRGAINILDELSRQYPNDPNLRQDRAEVEDAERQRREIEARRQAEAKKLAERQEAIARGEAKARAKADLDDLEGAIRVWEDLRAHYPGEPEVEREWISATEAWRERQQELAQIEAAEQERRRREQAVDTAKNQAIDLVAKEDFQGALELLRVCEGEYPGEDQLYRAGLAVRQAEQKWREQKALAEFQSALDSAQRQARDFIRDHDFAAAMRVWDELEARYPANDEVQRGRQAVQLQEQSWLEEEARRWAEEEARRERERLIASARRQAALLIQKRDFQGAIRILEELIASHPDESDVNRELESARQSERRRLEAQARLEEEERIRKERKRAIAAAIEDADHLVRKGDLDGATRLMEKIERKFPGETEVITYLQNLSQARVRRDEDARLEAEKRARQDREQAIRKSLGEASGLVAKGDFKAAIQSLTSINERYPGSPEVVDTLEEANRLELKRLQEASRREAEERARREREQAVAKALREGATLMRNSDFQGAVHMLDRVNQRYPGNLEVVSSLANARQLYHAKREEDAVLERQKATASARNAALDALQRGDYRAAVDVIALFDSRYPDNEELQAERAEATSLAEQRRQAEERARRALKSLGRRKEPGQELGGKIIDPPDSSRLPRK